MGRSAPEVRISSVLGGDVSCTRTSHESTPLATAATLCSSQFVALDQLADFVWCEDRGQVTRCHAFRSSLKRPRRAPQQPSVPAHSLAERGPPSRTAGLRIPRSNQRTRSRRLSSRFNKSLMRRTALVKTAASDPPGGCRRGRTRAATNEMACFDAILRTTG
jgi:hypothetical protein